MLVSIIVFFCAIIYANFIEWILHRYILHGFGKHKQSVWSFHWGEHHRACRKFNNQDDSYKSIALKWNSKIKEILSLLLLCLIHFPIVLLSLTFFSGLVFHMCLYFYLHKKCHTNPEWGYRYLRWHYDHHLGKDQDCNWCVTFPLWDYILYTRKKNNF